MSKFTYLKAGLLSLLLVAGSVQARFVSTDPVQPKTNTGENFNRYYYANNNPYKFIDPDGRETLVIVNNNTPLIGTHVGAMVRRDGESRLYDPAGSFRNDIRGSGGMLSGVDADLGAYVRFQKTDGPSVSVFRFDTTPEQEAQIISNMEEIGDPRGLSCATSVSSALNGVGDFKNLGVIQTPRGVQNAMVDLKVQERQEARQQEQKPPPPPPEPRVNQK